jgi:hypothetical protein
MNTVFCPSCREEADANDLFCRRCGADQRPPVHGTTSRRQMSSREMRNAVIILSSLALNSILIGSLAINRLRDHAPKPPAPFHLPEFHPPVAADVSNRGLQGSVPRTVAPSPAPLSLPRGVRPNGFIISPSLPTTAGVRQNTTTFPPAPGVDRAQQSTGRSSTFSPPPTPEIEQSLSISSSSGQSHR